MFWGWKGRWTRAGLTPSLYISSSRKNTPHSLLYVILCKARKAVYFSSKTKWQETILQQICWDEFNCYGALLMKDQNSEISSLQLGIEREDKKCTFVLNVQQATIHTTVLLRMWDRGDKHLLFLLTPLRTTNHISPVTSLSLWVQGPKSHWPYEEGPHWTFFPRTCI